MKAGAECLGCLIHGQAESLRMEQDEEKKARYMREILHLAAESPDGITAPELSLRMLSLRAEYFGAQEYGSIKRRYNRMMLDRLPALRQKARESGDPLRAALCLARAANYIDFSMKQGVRDDLLERLMDGAEKTPLDEGEYARLLTELAAARQMAYISDNCGEIVLDRLVLELLKERFPALEITLLVRGREIVNDATMEDACQCGLDQMVRCIPNGSPVAGTVIADLSEEARKALLEADLILSKGQGNFETLQGCGLNVYYLFLCKCDWYMGLFGVERNTGMFLNERRVSLF